jgi:hypothetical protein
VGGGSDYVFFSGPKLVALAYWRSRFLLPLVVGLTGSKNVEGQFRKSNKVWRCRYRINIVSVFVFCVNCFFYNWKNQVRIINMSSFLSLTRK